MKSILKFTKGEAEAILHRLTLWDVFPEVFGDTDGLEHLAEDAEVRCQEFVRELEQFGHVVADPASELDREVLREAIEGSTWCAMFDPRNDDRNTQQILTAAHKMLRQCATKVEGFFGLPNGAFAVPDR